MNNLEKYMVITPTTVDVSEIKNALEKSDKFISNIIVSVDEVEKTSKKINELVLLASDVKEKKVSRFFGNKGVIESLQSVADFQADIVNELWGYQQKMFDQFKNLADNSNNLIMLGVANAAVTRAIIEQLRIKTSQSLSEEAQKQLFNVIHDLERQADAQDRISRLREKVDGLGQVLSQELNDEKQNRLNDIQILHNSIYEVESSLKKEISFIKSEAMQLKLHTETRNSLYLERFDSIASQIKEVSEIFKTEIDGLHQGITDLKSKQNTNIANLRQDINALQSKSKKTFWIGVSAIMIALTSIILHLVI